MTQPGADRPGADQPGRSGGHRGARRPARGRHEAASRAGGTGLLARLALRRSRWFWGAWVLALWATLPATVSKYATVMGSDPTSPAGRATADSLAGNVTMRALLGPPYDLFHPGPFTMWRVGTFVAAATALVGALGVVRATRAEEEDGRAELLRSGAVSPRAPLAAGVLVGLGACALLAVLVAATMPRPLDGALAVGLGIGLTGAVGVGAGAVAAQLASTARGARGIAASAVGLAYLVRAVADGAGTGAALGWASPLEWAAYARPYAGTLWWVLGLLAALAAALVACAFALQGRRDLGAGVLPVRPGPATGRVRGPWGLAWRLDRGSVLGWAVGVVVSGVGLGNLAGSVTQMVRDNPQVEAMFRRLGRGGGLLDSFYSAMLAIVVTVLGLLAVQLVARARREEERGHAELLLAGPVRRTALLLPHVVLALVVPTVLLTAVGALMALPQALDEGSAAPLARVAGAGLVLAPGLWVVTGIAVALLGWAPRLGTVAWVVLGWSVAVVWLGALLQLPDALQRLTLWHALPALPGAPMAWTPVLVTTALAGVLLAAGLTGYRRRGIPG